MHKVFISLTFYAKSVGTAGRWSKDNHEELLEETVSFNTVVSLFVITTASLVLFSFRDYLYNFIKKNISSSQ